MKKFIAILRSPRFSPGKVEQDAAILRLVAYKLREQGHQVDVFTEQEFQQHFLGHLDQVSADCIFGMYREDVTLDMLEQLETQRHIPCVNSPRGIRRVSHVNQIALLREAGLPIPPTTILTSPDQLSQLTYPCWLKKGRGWSERPDDVVRVNTPSEAQSALPQFVSDDGTLCVVASAHIEGRHEKFYCPATTPLPRREGTGVGLEGLKGLEDLLPVFGGDAIITPEGHTYIIDINDWPSFSTCREEAAKLISQYVLSIH